MTSLNETETVEAPAVDAPAEAPAKELPPEDKEDGTDKKDETTGGSKPPENERCKICGRERPCNRRHVCYVCHVEANLVECEKLRGREWKAGDPHPDYCDCEGLGEHRNPDGTDRGAN